MSIISLVPFDIDAIDSQQDEVSLKKRLMALGKKGMTINGIVGHAAAEFLGTLLCRKDFIDELKEYLLWTKPFIMDNSSNNKDIHLQNQILYSVYKIFRRGEKAILLDYAKEFIHYIQAMTESNSNILSKKMATKIYQSIGLLLLKPRIPKWKHSPKMKSLEMNLGATNIISNNTDDINDDDDEYEVPEEIEFIISSLLELVKEKQTLVRWSAAKGIARITNRLPLELADEIIGYILDNFTHLEPDSTWHGSCLAIAELIRRGLFLTSRISELIPKIVLSLKFDQRKGNFLIGSNVRDAACYVCWSLARSYTGKELNLELQSTISKTLLHVALFDREVHCRRAAAAAFQECVGRQCSFPHGIDIISIVNFFTTSNRTNCFTKLAPKIAEYKEYSISLINCLSFEKYSHSDLSIRTLTSKSLAKMTLIEPEYFISTIIPHFIKMSTSKDFNVRHGAILSLSEILKSIDNVDLLETEKQSEIRDITKVVLENKLCKGKESHHIRVALCKLINSITILKFNLDSFVNNKQESIIAHSHKEQSYLEYLLEFLEDNLQFPMENVNEQASKTLENYLSHYFSSCSSDLEVKLTQKWMKLAFSDVNLPTRRGFCLGLGSLSESLLNNQIHEVINNLLEGMKQEKDKDIDLRKNCILSLTKIIKKIGFEGDRINEEETDRVLYSLILLLDDYTFDNRGDIGSLIRETSIRSTHSILLLLYNQKKIWFKFDILILFLQKIVKQLFEKIDRTRSIAGETFQSLLNEFDLLQSEVNGDFKDINWSSPNSVFPSLIHLIENPRFQKSILLGLSRSIGGKNNNKELVEVSLNTIRSYLASHNASSHSIALTMIEILKELKGSESEIAATFRTVESFLEMDCFSTFHPSTSPFTVELINIIKQEIRKATLSKLFAIIPVVTLLLAFDDPTRKESFKMLFKFLRSQYPKIRKLASESMYLQLQINSDIIQDENTYNTMIELLSDFPWDSDVKAYVNNIENIMGFNNKE